MGNGIGKLKTTVNVSAGVETFKSDVSKVSTENTQAQNRTWYQAGTLGVGVNIPTGKTSVFTPKISAEIGPDVKGIGGYLGAEKQITPKLSATFGLGLDNRKFTTASATDGYDIANGQETGMNGESGLIATGDYREQTEVTINTRSASHKTTGYLAAGAKYQVNPKLSVSGQLQGGLTYLNPSSKEVRITDGEYVTQGAELVYEQFDEDFGTYVWQGSPKIEKKHNETTYTENGAGGFTGAVKLGADYQINKHLAAGVESKIGIGQYADPVQVGAHLKVKF